MIENRNSPSTLEKIEAITEKFECRSHNIYKNAKKLEDLIGKYDRFRGNENIEESNFISSDNSINPEQRFLNKNVPIRERFRSFMVYVQDFFEASKVENRAIKAATKRLAEQTVQIKEQLRKRRLKAEEECMRMEALEKEELEATTYTRHDHETTETQTLEVEAELSGAGGMERDFMKEVDEIHDCTLAREEQAPQVQSMICKEKLVEQDKEQVCDLQPKEYEENRFITVPLKESSSAEGWDKPKTPKCLDVGNFDFQRVVGMEGRKKESLVPRWKNPPSAPNEGKLMKDVMIKEESTTLQVNPNEKRLDGSIGTTIKPMQWEESEKEGTFIEKDETSKTRLVFDPGTFIQNFNKFSNPYTVLKEHVGECLEFITKELNDASQLDETKKSFMEEPYILEQQITPSMKSNRMKLRSIRPISKPPWRKGEKAQSKRVWTLRYPP